MQQKYLLVSLMILIMGCTNGLQKAKLIPQKNIVFDLPFEPTLIPIGYCERGDTQNSFYYFADFRTARQIAFCNSQGNVISTIDLKAWMKDNDPWYFMQVRSPDSIVAISANQTELFFFNRDSLIYKHIISPIQYQQSAYTIYCGPQPPDLGFNTAFSYIELRSKDFQDTISGNVNWDSLYSVSYKGPTLAKFNSLFSAAPNISLILPGLQSRFMPEGTGSWLPLYFNSDSKVYYVNPYSDTLYEFDINLNTLSKQVHLQSMSGNIGAKPGIYDDNNSSQAHSDTVRDLKAVVRYGKYDKYRKLIYLMFYHEVPADAKPIHKGEHRPWSMFIYNEQLEKLAEIPFKADTYVPQSLIVNQEGILLKKMDINLEERSYKQTFQQFSIEL